MLGLSWCPNGNIYTCTQMHTHTHTCMPIHVCTYAYLMYFFENQTNVNISKIIQKILSHASPNH